MSSSPVEYKPFLTFAFYNHAGIDHKNDLLDVCRPNAQQPPTVSTHVIGEERAIYSCLLELTNAVVTHLVCASAAAMKQKFDPCTGAEEARLLMPVGDYLLRRLSPTDTHSRSSDRI